MEADQKSVYVGNVRNNPWNIARMSNGILFILGRLFSDCTGT